MAYNDIGTVASGDAAKADWANGVRANQQDHEGRIAQNESDISQNISDISTLQGQQIGFEIAQIFAGSSEIIDSAGVVLINETLNASAKLIEIDCTLTVDSTSLGTELSSVIGRFKINHDASSVITGSYCPVGKFIVGMGVYHCVADATITKAIAAINSPDSYITISTYGGPGGNLTIRAYGLDADITFASVVVTVWS